LWRATTTKSNISKWIFASAVRNAPIFASKPGTPLKGVACTNDVYYQDIVRDRRIVFASAMSLGEKCISASLVTVEFLKSGTGTELVCTHQGAFFEGSDGPEMRKEGWRTLFDKLTAEFGG